MTMKKLMPVLASLLLPVLLALLPAAAGAQESVGNFMYKYDLDSTTLIFCKLAGLNGDPLRGLIPGPALVKTAGSSTSVTENTVGQNPFTNIAVGDMISVRRPTGVDTRVVVTRTDAANITVDAAVDWTGGFQFSYKTLQCGTTANDGWIDASASASAASNVTITYNIVQQNTTTGIDMRIECRSSVIGAQPVQVYPATGFTTDTAATIGFQHAITINGRWSACRVGVKITSTDDGGDTGANAEQITAGITK